MMFASNQNSAAFCGSPSSMMSTSPPLPHRRHPTTSLLLQAEPPPVAYGILSRSTGFQGNDRSRRWSR
ncbi:hypothetical protein NL676_029632 [Syzygium grande]|nr:hypothetical protein NL676_029632 [Syzygium grande]